MIEANMESDNSLTKVADAVLTGHISRCHQCELTQYKTGDNWKPCEFHRGFVAGIIALINQISIELESVGFNGNERQDAGANDIETTNT